MAKIAVWNWKKEQVGEVPVPTGVLDYPYRKHLVWVVVKAYLAGQRAGTHKTKVRSEVSGSGRKPFKQKGTGRARQGGGRPPIHRHGGIAHGPKPRSYAQDVSVGEKKNALKAVLSRRFAEERIVVVDRMELDGHKTRDLKAAVGALAGRGHQRISCEGGPHLLAQLAGAGLLDELCLTVSPVLAGPGAGRILTGGPPMPGGGPQRFTLAHAVADEGYLLCRYVRPSAG